MDTSSIQINYNIFLTDIYNIINPNVNVIL